MYLKKLLIKNEEKIIREISFHEGLNLIVDETKKEESSTDTGNNVGKTTVLKLIHFCFDGDAKEIYTSTENAKDEYRLVKDFLLDNKISVTLILKEDLNDDNSKEIEIERNFSKNKSYRKINKEILTKEEFETNLKKEIFKDLKADKPTLKQLIGMNIRYKERSLANTIKYLDSYTKDVEYETLYLYLLGCSNDNGQEKEELLAKLNQETKYKTRLEADAPKKNYEILLASINQEIEVLKRKKKNLNINENFEKELNELNNLKLDINHISETISLLEMRKDLINETKNELESEHVDIDLMQLKMIYQEALENIGSLNKSFSEFVAFHNQMIKNKVKYITKELPEIEEKILSLNQELTLLLEEEKKRAISLHKSDTFSDLEDITDKLNEKFQKKGEYEGIISKIEESEIALKQIEKEINEINDSIMSESFEACVKKQVTKFNEFFKDVSQFLYNETYYLTYNIKTNKKTEQKYYEFSTFNANLSSGKKQGEIICFDIAMIMFLKSQGQCHLSFLLNDKKELMDNNQLIKVAQYAKENHIQLVFSMLADKVPMKFNNDENIILKLSQKDKLFRIEK